MLTAMRNSANNIFVKLALLLVAVAFCFWGMASWIVQDVGVQYIAVIGNEKIPYSLYEAKVREYVQRWEQVTGKPVPENSPEFDNIRRGVLDGMVYAKMLEKRSADLGVRIGNDVLQSEIAKERMFADADGNFDPARFTQYLQAAGQGKREFFARQRDAIRTDFLRRMFNYVPLMPQELLNRIRDYRYEGRIADVLAIPLDAEEAEGEPSETDLIDLYKENSALFYSPEYRTVNYIRINPSLTEKDVKTDDALLRPFFDENVDQYNMDEMRHLLQYRFETEEEAKKAYAEITKDGADKKAFAADDSGLSDTYNRSRTDAGTFRKDELMEDFREKVFAAKEGDYVPPIRSAFGWHVFYVKEISPAHVASFEEAKEQVRKDYVRSRVDALYPEFIGTIEDRLAEGASLEELAKEIKAELHSVTVDASGKDMAGAPVDLGDGQEELLRRIFGTEEKGVPSLPVALDEGEEYATFEVKSVTPERTKALDEVKGKVIGLWKDIKRRKRLTDEVANALRPAEGTDKERAPEETLKALSDRFSLPLETNVEIHRPVAGAPPQSAEYLTDAIADKAFSAQVGEIAVAYYEEGRKMLVIHLRESVPAAKAVGVSRIRSAEDAWRQQFAEDFMQQYLKFLKAHYRVKYNTDLL
jgi:peptidyl-prolyl cis-trans isomerase D